MTWPSRHLLDVVRDVSGGNAKVAQRDYLERGSLAVVDQGRALIGGYSDDEGVRHRTPGPVIVFGDHTKVIKYVDFPFAMGADGVKVLQVEQDWDPRFVYHYLNSVELPNMGYSRHFKFLKELSVPQPPIDEQHRIAAILDKVEVLESVRAQGVTRLDVVLEAAFGRMFSTPGLPSVALAQLGTITTGKTPPTSEGARVFGGAIPFVTPGDLGSGRPVARTVTEDGASLSRTARAGATLVCCIGSVGKADRIREVSAFNQQINAVEWGPDVQDEYGTFAVRKLKPLMLARAGSTTLPLLNKSQFSRLEIPVPPMRLQQEFAGLTKAIELRAIPMLEQVPGLATLSAALRARAFSGRL